MEIHGLQKLTLLDYPGKLACTVFTPGCNFRCPFCHNASLVTHIDPANQIPLEEILDFLRKRKKFLEGVCVSGGEPLLQKDLEKFLRSVKALGFCVKLDTNGSNFQRLKGLVQENLVDYVAMDIKQCPSKYKVAVGIDEFDMQQINESVGFLLTGAVSYEFRTTVVKELHEPSDFEKIGMWIKGAEKYFLQLFVDSGDIIKPGLHPCLPDTLKLMLKRVKKYVPNAEIRGDYL